MCVYFRETQRECVCEREGGGGGGGDTVCDVKIGAS